LTRSTDSSGGTAANVPVDLVHGLRRPEHAGGFSAARLLLAVRDSFPDEGAAADGEEPKGCPACGPIEALLEGCR